MTPEQAAALRAPFPKEAIGKLPKGGTTLDYVGHAAVTDRLLAVDRYWSWEPFAIAPDGGPLVRESGKEAKMWIRMTVCGVTRVAVGIAPVNAFELDKQLISDAIRNGAMRFGVALDLWSKEDFAPEPVPEPVDTGGFATRDEWTATVKSLRTAVQHAGLTEQVKALGLAFPWRLADCEKVREVIATYNGTGEQPGADPLAEYSEEPF